MTQEDKYKKALLEARAVLEPCLKYSNGKVREALDSIDKELKSFESEDERIRKWLIDYFKAIGKSWLHHRDISIEQILAYLEKQKENPKSADSISADCVSDAKCEDRWHKVGDSLPDNPREVLCKDEAGNYFIGRYYVGEGWEISNYDDEDKPHHLNPPVSKWIDFPLEKQKEPHKRLRDKTPWIVTAKEELAHDEERLQANLEELHRIRAKKEKQKEQKPAEWSDTNELVFQDICKHLKEEGFGGWIVLLEALKNGEFNQSKLEWSEEDKKMIDCIINVLASFPITITSNYNGGTSISYGGFKYQKEMDWLKSLRPSWKPSDLNTNCQGCLYWTGKCKLPKGLDCPEKKEEKK